MSDTEAPELTGFGVANYRSFDDGGFVIDGLRKINIFIGKNNSGKSNILRAIRLLRCVKTAAMGQGEGGLCLKPEIDSHDQARSPVSMIAMLPLEGIARSNDRFVRNWEEKLGDFVHVRWNSKSGAVEECKNLVALSDGELYALHSALDSRRYMRQPARERLVGDIGKLMLPCAIEAMRTFDRLICVENFREIRSVDGTASESETFNGYNVIARLREMQHPRIGDEDQREVFDDIQDFVCDLVAEPGLLLEVPPSEDAVYVSMHGKRLPLESYGTGLHQLVILCAALAMHDDHIVCIEEPEIHIHPELQRKFLRFIAEETNHRYFITTHSNVFLDAQPDVAIYHVTHDGTKSTMARVDASSRARDVLADLGYKASDLLQANCVIWVEGPSDRVYLNKWLSLAAPELVEGIHYSITFYGGKVLGHFTASDDPAEDLVEVL